MRKRRPTTPFEGELHIDWERWADGRARRLKRKRDFPDVDPAVVRADASTAAKQMGKGVMTAKDKFLPEKYVWVQFADHRVGPGEPCPCGSNRLLRVHTNFLRCPECHAQLLLTDEPEEDEEKESRTARQLRVLTDVHLERRGETGDLELYRGYALKAGTPVLVWVNFRRKPREDRIAEKDVFDRVVTVRTVPFAELTELFNADHRDALSLWNGREPMWDFVWEGGEEPEEQLLSETD